MTTMTHKPVQVLDQARTLLDAGEPQKALELLSRSSDRAPWMENARGVCLMRLGRAEKAVPIYRSLLLSGGVTMNERAPETFKLNFATALMLTGNVIGGITILDELHDAGNPAVVRLREAVARWRKSLSVVQRIMTSMGAAPEKPVVLDFPPGEA